MSSGYNPRHIGPTTPPTPTGAHTVIPRREPSIVAVRQSFEDTFGGYTPPAWTLDALCTEHDPSIFFPTKTGPQAEALALKVCARCPVRQKCLDEAIEYETGSRGDGEIRPEVHGTRGGMTAKDRRLLVDKVRAEQRVELRKAVVADYAAGALLVEQIAEKHGVSDSTIVKWAKADGVPARPSKGGRKPKGDAA